jgi:signal recognition particle GTPase
MTVMEIENPDTLTFIAKERIAKTAGLNTDQMARMVHAYKQSLIVHTWLQTK